MFPTVAPSAPSLSEFVARGGRLGIADGFMPDLCQVVVDKMGEPVQTVSALMFAQWSFAGIGTSLDMNERIAVMASAQDFPAKPIKLIVPWAAGGDTDNIFRPFAPPFQKHLGQTVVIENRGGAPAVLSPGNYRLRTDAGGFAAASCSECRLVSSIHRIGEMNSNPMIQAPTLVAWPCSPRRWTSRR